MRYANSRQMTFDSLYIKL